jgi:hypothetical protein
MTEQRRRFQLESEYGGAAAIALPLCMPDSTSVTVFLSPIERVVLCLYIAMSVLKTNSGVFGHWHSLCADKKGNNEGSDQWHQGSAV